MVRSILSDLLLRFAMWLHWHGTRVWLLMFYPVNHLWPWLFLSKSGDNTVVIRVSVRFYNGDGFAYTLYGYKWGKALGFIDGH